MKKYPVIVLLIFLFTAASSFAADLPYTHPATGIGFSSDIAGFQFVARKDFEPQDPGMGVGFTYRRGSVILASVYLYSAGAGNIADGVDSPEVAEELDRVSEDIHKTAKQGRYRNFKTLNEKSVARFGDVRYLGSEHSYDTPGKNPETLVVGHFITGLNRHFVKIRFTYLKSKQTEALPGRDAFLAEMARRMKRGK